ncbi:hypothetical protein A2U01_0081159, partial [Trifolium medium]|nr:hypothetical protein [Trifolium medium]
DRPTMGRHTTIPNLSFFFLRDEQQADAMNEL